MCFRFRLARVFFLVTVVMCARRFSMPDSRDSQ